MSTINYYDIELNENNKLAEQPTKIKINLKPHQLTALNKAIEMENNGKIQYKISNKKTLNNLMNMLFIDTSHIASDVINISTNVGIFGDMVGYGKTLIALSLIANNDTNNIHINNEYFKSFNSCKNYSYLNISTANNLISIDTNTIKATLIVVPRGPVYIQWLNMINTYTNLKVLTIDNLNTIKKHLPKFTGSNKAEIINYFNNFDIILIKNTTLKILFSQYYDNNDFIINNWKRIIIDEAHDIINTMPFIRYYYLWMISGTYQELLRKIYYCYTPIIYNNTFKELFNTEFINLILVKNNDNFIKNSFNVPEPVEKFYLCKLAANINIIRTFLSENLLDKINANDIAGAIKELGGKNETEDDIIELVSKELKRDLFNKETEKNYINSLDIPAEQKNLRLKNINHEIELQEEKIKDLTERISSINSKNCSICMDLMTNPIFIECTHVFCGKCLIKWLHNNRNCPICRLNIPTADKLIAIVNDNKKDIIEDLLNKEDTLLKIINSKPNGKFLIFSKNENSFEKIKQRLSESTLNYELLKGNTTHMMNILDKFRSGNLNIILLNTQYAGSGIDISCATDIIIFHKMGADKQQAIGRAQRVGRQSQLFIHNLYYEHEF
jgi:SNF2 family DNA or RNA helicase